MRHLIKTIMLLMLTAFPATVSAAGWTVHDETLHYSVRFKWGLIDANVGIATVSTRNIPGTDTFEATLSGKSIDLLGHYYIAGDDIRGTLLADPMKPSNNATLQCEHGEFTIETVTYDADGPSKNGPEVGHLDNGQVIRARQSNYASGLTIDLLSVFYYMRQIDYGESQPGASYRINLANGSEIDHLHIVYIDEDDCDVNGESVSCHHIALTFSAGNNSDTMEVWIADDAARTPVFIKGGLSVGHMECHIVDQQTVSSLSYAGK